MFGFVGEISRCTNIGWQVAKFSGEIHAFSNSLAEFDAFAGTGDLVFIELPTVGKQLKAGQGAVVLESVKAASDAYSPVAGEVIAINQAVADAPETLNAAPYDAWLFKLKPATGTTLDGMLDSAGYAASIGAA